MSNQVKFSVVIPTYNHLEDCLKPCLESIIQHTELDENIEIIVVANGCNDGTVEYVRNLNIDQIKVIVYKDALGYTAATNKGIICARGEYIVLLNNDVTLLPQEKNCWIDLLYKPFEVDETVGITGAVRIKNYDIDRDFMVFHSVMIKRQMFYEIGLLDESFSPGAGEDTDFFIKLQDAGYKMVQVPDKQYQS